MITPTSLLARCVAPALGAALLGGLALAPAAAAEPSGPMFAGYTDKSDLTAAGRAVVASGELPVTDGTAPSAAGTTYYVDSVAGSDGADGLSPATAWQSLDHVNTMVFAPGDRILLKAGGVWDAAGDTVAKEAYDYTSWSGGVPTDVDSPAATALLAPQGSGTAAAPIVLSSYGDGAAPELNGRGVVNDVLQLTNQEHWDISQIEITNVFEGFDPSRFSPGANNGLLPGEENPATGDLRGIHVQAESAGVLSGFSIHDVFVHDVSGVIWSIGNTGLDRSKRTGGILFEGLKGDAVTPSQFQDVTLADNVVANTSFSNVAFKQFSGMGTYRYQDVDPGWGDRAVAKASTSGVITEDPDWRPHSDIVVTGNYLTNRDTAYGWDSLYLTSVQDATVEGNVVDGSGVSGIEMYYSDNIVVQDNEVAEVEKRANAADSNGIDPDRGTSNILIQGNYVHESGEGILLCGFAFGTAVVRYNVIEDVDRNYVNPHGDSGVQVIYGNLMYNTQAPLSSNTVGFFRSSGDAGSYLVAKNRHHVIDNVFINTRATVSASSFQASYPGVTFASNAYYGPSVVPPAEDATAVTGDPALGGDPAADLSSAAIAAATSSLIAAGSEVDLSALAPGFGVTGAGASSALPLTVDFFGQALTSPPTIGPAVYVPAAGLGLATGLVLAEDGLPVGGATVSWTDAGSGAGSVVADASGRYALEAPAGAYSLVASAPQYADGLAVPVTLADQRTVGADLLLGATSATSGTLAGIVSSAGIGLAGATVEVSLAGTTVASTTTGVDGAYAVAGIPAGEAYTVTVSLADYETATVADVSVTAARTTAVDVTLASDLGETEYFINEDFDDEPLGAFTATADGVLVAEPNAAVGTIEIQADPADPANQVLAVSKTSSSSGSLTVHNAVEADLTGTVTIEARVMRTSTFGSPNQVALYSYTESNWKATDPASSSNPSATFGFSGGKIIAHNVTGSSSVKQVASYTQGRWYTIRNVVHLGTGTFDFYVDDMTAPVLTNQPLRTPVDDLDWFNIFVNGSNRGDLVFDYLRVNTGAPYERDDASLGTVSATVDGVDVALTASADGTAWSGTVDPFASTATLAVSPTSIFASATVAGEPVGPGEGVEVALGTGANDEAEVVTEVPVVVTAEDGSQRTVTVALTRINPSQLAQLADLTVTGYALTPQFSPSRVGAEQPYAVEELVPAEADALEIAWQPGWDGQQVEVDGVLVPAGATSTDVALAEGLNSVEVTVSSFPGDFATYVIEVEREVSDAVRPETTLISPTTAGPFTSLELEIAATDDRGLERIVANIYRDGVLVRSTQSTMDGATSGTHRASVELPDGDYTVRYNAQDLAGNLSVTRTVEVTIDATAPTLTLKAGSRWTNEKEPGVYTKVSLTLADAGTLASVELNGSPLDLAGGTVADLDKVTVDSPGAVAGDNVLVVTDVAGNVTTAGFVLR
ncbi:carboxypeptidase regulatory-like domain-containing protein [Demequina lignilytica]|uniref:Carboxypeptidase regulatory-like domain-containing protein n=1 Tax=Demequina lignilytica TaxID=3051663 RepID=A0AB35MEV1_9MICO|nr:carboxypeptidase regulatory-like domain-containing protein [Demequina sp. SYSU T0a273]MDN4482281.1 carboxypeptidase regulatory-like domain-containing protein [Demequina sp. SYSU T0a273]